MTTTRAVLRQVEPGNSSRCAWCGSPVRFAARTHAQQVIANVYLEGAWDRVEHYHSRCYSDAGSPHGEPVQPGPLARQGPPGRPAADTDPAPETVPED
jgi:hypothetical protein